MYYEIVYDMLVNVNGIYYVHVCEQVRWTRSAGNSAVENLCIVIIIFNFTHLAFWVFFIKILRITESDRIGKQWVFVAGFDVWKPSSNILTVNARIPFRRFLCVLIYLFNIFNFVSYCCPSDGICSENVCSEHAHTLMHARFYVVV